jgi:phosphatidate cytidylyltransferase
LITRAITGILFVASIVLSSWFNDGLAVIVFSLFFIVGVFEYKSLFSSHPKIKLNSLYFLLSSILLFALVIFCIYFNLNYFYLGLIIPCLFVLILTELWRKKEEPILNISVGLLGYVYLLIPFSLIIVLQLVSTHSFPILIGMFFLIWTNDTFAYLSGRLLGKTKLIERISPNKTWEGTIGGIVFTLIVGFCLGLQNGGEHMDFWFISAIIIAPCAIVGDLIESLFKRNLNIKDSGTILPGHGGILDRFDATLFTVPFYFFWWIFYTNTF